MSCCTICKLLFPNESYFIGVSQSITTLAGYDRESQLELVHKALYFDKQIVSFIKSVAYVIKNLQSNGRRFEI